MWEGSAWPKALGRYCVKGVIGRGSMGTVFLAHDPVIDRDVAVKLMTFTRTMNVSERRKYIERFLREARAAGRVSHPNVVQIFDVGFYEDIPYIVMERVRGITLHDQVRRLGPLAPEEAVDVGVRICDALEAAHASGVLHRDVKPTNVLITSDGGVKLVDLSIAKLQDAEITDTGETWGSPAYMSPEQIKGDELDARTDIFSTGATLYFAVTGERPFTGANVAEVVNAIMYRKPVPPSSRNPGVPQSLSDVILRCMEKDRDNRFDDAGALKRALLACAERKRLPTPARLSEAPEYLDSFSRTWMIFTEKTSSLRRTLKEPRKRGLMRRIVDYFFS